MGKKKEQEQPEIRYQQPPEYGYQMQLFKDIQEPYMRGQYGLYRDIFEPQMRELGGVLGEQLKQPLSLPEDVWANIWQRGRERAVGEFEPLRQQATERAAGRGMLEQGPTERYFQTLDIAQAKSIEDTAIDMAISEWTEKKQAREQAIAQSTGFLGYQPQFGLPMPTSQPYTYQPPGREPEPWERYMGIVGDPGGSYLGLYGSGAQQTSPISGLLGGGLGKLFGGGGGGGGGGGSSNVIQGGIGGQTFNTSQFGTTWSPYT